jgi:hypothetical protein
MERKENKTSSAQEDESLGWKPKKAKSANSLSAILKRSQRGRKAEGSKDVRDKENRSPSDLVDSMPSPVWNPYGSDSFHNQTGVPQSPNNRRTLQEEVSLYTPKGYGPAQQRNFYDHHQPSLANRSDAKPRPKSDNLSGNRKLREALGSVQTVPSDNPIAVDQPETESQRGQGRPRMSRSESHPEPETKPDASPKKPSRVQAAISAFNAKEKEAEVQRRLNPKDLESEFEKLLVSLPN